MPAPTEPYQPYAAVHANPSAPGDARPTAIQVVKDCDAIGKLKGRTALITGTSSGIGVETARALYEAGATLFLTARDMPKLEQVVPEIAASSDAKDVPRPRGVEISLDSLESVRKGAEAFEKASGGKLDIFDLQCRSDGIPIQADRRRIREPVRHLPSRTLLAFELVKPLLLKSAKESATTSRVIAISSAGHRIAPVNFDNVNYTEETYNPYAAYGQAKTANILTTNAINRYYGGQGLVGVSIHPGGIAATGLWKSVNVEELAATGDADALAKSFKSAEQGAATTTWAAVSSRFADAANAGRLLGDVGECRAAKEEEALDYLSYAPWAYDEAGEDRLWEISSEMVGISARLTDANPAKGT